MYHPTSILLPPFLLTPLTATSPILGAVVKVSHIYHLKSTSVSIISKIINLLTLEVQQKVWCSGHLRRSHLAVLQRLSLQPSSNYSFSPTLTYTPLRLLPSPYHSLSFILRLQLKSPVTVLYLNPTHHLPPTLLHHDLLLRFTNPTIHLASSSDRLHQHQQVFIGNPLVYIDDQFKISNQPRAHLFP